MKNLSLFLALFIAITMFSCSKDDQTSEFQGNWTGIYSGNSDNGTFEMNVDDEGVITGTVTSNIIGSTFTVEGNVQDNGSLDATAGTTSSGATFTGTMGSSVASGTWNNAGAGINGTWNGNKQ